MTWTLRLFDETGTEIAVVTRQGGRASYAVDVAHPNPDAWDKLTGLLRNAKMLEREAPNRNDVKRENELAPGWHISMDTFSPETDKQHLEWVRDDVVGLSLFGGKVVDSATLEDE